MNAKAILAAAMISVACWLPWAGADEPRLITGAEYLRSLPQPHVRPGHSLARLTRYGWTLPLELRVELAGRWGYALEFGGYATMKQAEKVDDPNSIEGKLAALSASDPATYGLAVILTRELPAEPPAETWTRDANGELVDGKKIWSPQAPRSVSEGAAELRAAPLRKILTKGRIAIILNGGEYALGVEGHHAKAWQRDPRVLAAKGNRSWFDYVSDRKAGMETLIGIAVRQAAPDRQFYIYYTAGGGTHRNRYAGWDKWAHDFAYLRHASDLPTDEFYWQHFNSGWTGDNDLLTQALNAKAFEIAFGAPLSYNWLCAGWPREKTPNGGLGELDRYMGFLKCLYAAGMIGGNAGYYAYPPGGFAKGFPAEEPPHWLRQMVALARVHAMFSHLEEYLRDGYLLAGPDRHRWSADMPAYELPTGDGGTRVLARRLRLGPRWLIAAWAADGGDRDVKVAVPELGEVALRARPCGAVYLAERKDGKGALKLVDADGLLPSAGLPPGQGARVP